MGCGRFHFHSVWLWILLEWIAGSIKSIYSTHKRLQTLEFGAKINYRRNSVSPSSSLNLAALIIFQTLSLHSPPLSRLSTVVSYWSLFIYHWPVSASKAPSICLSSPQPIQFHPSPSSPCQPPPSLLHMWDTSPPHAQSWCRDSNQNVDQTFVSTDAA